MTIKDPRAQMAIKGVTEKKVRTPTCPGCGAKFSHDAATASCKVCGLADEVLTGGVKAVQRWAKEQDRPLPRGGSFYRRKRRHGRCQPAPYRPMPV